MADASRRAAASTCTTQFGTFFSPRISALLRHESWTTRASVGSGFFAPTALTEETEAAGLARLSIPRRSRRSADGARRLTSRRFKAR